MRERTADLGRANEEIQRFAYIVTHDLRAPLVNVMGFTSELEGSLDADPDLRETGRRRRAMKPKEGARGGPGDLPEAISFIRSWTARWTVSSTPS